MFALYPVGPHMSTLETEFLDIWIYSPVLGRAVPPLTVTAWFVGAGKAASPNSGISLSWPLSSSRPSSVSAWSREPFELKVRLAGRAEMYGPVISEFSRKLTLSETLVWRAAVTVHFESNYLGAFVHWSITRTRCTFRRWIQRGHCRVWHVSQLALNHNILTFRYIEISYCQEFALLLSKS